MPGLRGCPVRPVEAPLASKVLEILLHADTAADANLSDRVLRLLDIASGIAGSFATGGGPASWSFCGV